MLNACKVEYVEEFLRVQVFQRVTAPHTSSAQLKENLGDCCEPRITALKEHRRSYMVFWLRFTVVRSVAVSLPATSGVRKSVGEGIRTRFPTTPMLFPCLAWSSNKTVSPAFCHLYIL